MCCGKKRFHCRRGGFARPDSSEAGPTSQTQASSQTGSPGSQATKQGRCPQFLSLGPSGGCKQRTGLTGPGRLPQPGSPQASTSENTSHMYLQVASYLVSLPEFWPLLGACCPRRSEILATAAMCLNPVTDLLLLFGWKPTFLLFCLFLLVPDSSEG